MPRPLYKMDARPEVALYRLWSSNDVLLYVGISKTPGDRIATHRRKQPWSILIARASVDWCKNRGEALRLEAAAVASEGPLFNIDMNEGRERPWMRMLADANSKRHPTLSWTRIALFAEVANRDPHILDLFQYVQSLDEMCGDCLWKPVRDAARRMVGYDAENEAVRNSSDYEIVLSTLYEYMPWYSCDNCAAA